MEFVQFHPTGMVWPPSVRGILVTEGVRGDGGTLKNSKGERFMFNYIPEFFKAETADTEEEADRWYEDKKNNRRTPDLLPRDEVARAINSEVKAGRGTPARRRVPRHRLAARRRLHPQAPAVDVPPVQGAGRRRHHQGADGGRPDLPLHDGRGAGRRRHHRGHRARPLRGGRVRGRHARRQPARRQLAVATCWSSAGARACTRRTTPRTWAAPLTVDAGAGGADRASRCSSPSRAPAARTRTRSSPTCRRRCRTWSGIIRDGGRARRRRSRSSRPLKDRAKRVRVEGGRHYNPGWHTALDLASLLTVSRGCALRGAGAQGEPRRPHPRGPSRTPTSTWGTVNLVLPAEGRPDASCGASRCPRCRPSSRPSSQEKK